MTDIIITGASGRMGRNLLDAVKQHKETTLAGATEKPDSSLIGTDAGEMAGIGTQNVNIVDSLSSLANSNSV